MTQYGMTLARAMETARDIQRVCDKRFGTGRAQLDDLKGSRPLPMAQMPAKFLAIKVLNHGALGPVENGIAAVDLAVLQGHLDMTGDASGQVLRFFLAAEVLMRYLLMFDKGGRCDARMACLERALTTLLTSTSLAEAK